MKAPTIKPIHIDGTLIFLVAACGAWLGCFSSDSVYHYVNATAVFWSKTLATSIGAGCTALIGFRSKVYARYSDSLTQPPASPVESDPKTSTL